MEVSVDAHGFSERPPLSLSRLRRNPSGINGRIDVRFATWAVTEILFGTIKHDIGMIALIRFRVWIQNMLYKPWATSAS